MQDLRHRQTSTIQERRLANYHLCLEELGNPGTIKGGCVFHEHSEVLSAGLRAEPAHSTDALHSTLLNRCVSISLNEI